MNRKILATVAFVLGILAAPISALAQADPLPSWNDGPTKHAITDFVARVTTEGHTDFVAAHVDTAFCAHGSEQCPGGPQWDKCHADMAGQQRRVSL